MDIAINRIMCAACKGHCCQTEPGPTAPEDWGAPNKAEMVRRIFVALGSSQWVTIAHRSGIAYIAPRKLETGCTFLSSSGCTLPRDAMPERCQTLVPGLAVRVKPGLAWKEFCRQPEDMTTFLERWKPYQSLLGNPPKKERTFSLWQWLRGKAWKWATA